MRIFDIFSIKQLDARQRSEAKKSDITINISAYFIFFIFYFKLSKVNFAEQKDTKQLLKIVIPEDLDYQEEFNALFTSYGVKYKLLKVKTTALGSLFQLYYELEMPTDVNLKEFMNEIRMRNSNLNISINMLENQDYKE